jgi:DNA topoisomerase-3
LKKLIIAEKPSVARNIAEALDIRGRKDGYLEGEDYVITWVFGHLLQLFDAADYQEERRSWKLELFPFIPEEFRYKVKEKGGQRGTVDSGAEKQVAIIRSLAEREDVESLISATDYDREGQIIADEVLLYLGIQKPVYRLLLNEWTKEEVLKGLAEIRPNPEMKPLQDAGFGRQLADWLIGINLTSVATVKYRNGTDRKNSQVLNIGRVLLPTLKIIYDRDQEIANFQSSRYYKLLVRLRTDRGESLEALYQEEENEKFEDPEVLKAIADQLSGSRANVTDKQVERKKEYPPYLFNLSNLQGHITSKYKGWTSDKVLKTAQELYEKKLITYPRTASSVLDESLKEKTAKVLAIHKKGLPYESEIRFHEGKRVFDSSKVESHSAIMPTTVVPNRLKEEEDIVYQAIRNRFLMQFMPVAESEETRLILSVPEKDVKGELLAKGKVQLAEGWKVVENMGTKETLLPSVAEGEELTIENAEVSEVVRKPPKPHTEKTLLRVMETCGKSFEEDQSEEMMTAILSGFSIGTPATRAETIKKLLDVGYIEAKGKNLLCTPLGKTLVETLPVKELFDLEYTGRLEKTLADIERKKFTKEEFLQLIVDFTKQSVELIKQDRLFGAPTQPPEGTDSLGNCPECGSPVIESPKAYGCSNWKNGCSFTIWKDDRFIQSMGKQVTPEMVKLLLANGKVGFRGLTSKKGNRFSAYFRYGKDTETGKYKWEMEFIPDRPE